jgi:cell division protein FtsB
VEVKRFLLIPAFVAAALVYAVFDADTGILASLQMREKLEVSRVRIGEIRRSIRTLRSQVAALESDPFAIECAIREDLKLAHRGEVVVRFASADGINPRFP